MFRYDSSRLGRFMTPDLLAGSIFNPQSLNRYGYVLNDPINLIDPFGLEHETFLDPSIGWTCGGVTYTIDGIDAPCALALATLSSGTGRVCVDNACTGTVINKDGKTVFVTYTCFANGRCSYLQLSDLTKGLRVFNGFLYDPENFKRLMMLEFADRIESQRQALARAIVRQSGGEITLSEALAGISTGNGGVEGGNFNFAFNNAVKSNLGNSCRDGGRCGAIHVKNGFIHLDTANPYSSIGGLFSHFFVDVVGGNVIWSVIPR